MLLDDPPSPKPSSTTHRRGPPLSNLRSYSSAYFPPTPPKPTDPDPLARVPDTEYPGSLRTLQRHSLLSAPAGIVKDNVELFEKQSQASSTPSSPVERPPTPAKVDEILAQSPPGSGVTEIDPNTVDDNEDGHAAPPRSEWLRSLRAVDNQRAQGRLSADSIQFPAVQHPDPEVTPFTSPTYPEFAENVMDALVR